MVEIPAETVADVAETAVPAVIPVPVEAEIPVAVPMPAVQGIVPKTADAAVRTETGITDLPDRISLILHRWMIRHFPEEMMEDVRPVDVNRIPDNKKPPEPVNGSGGYFVCEKLVGHYFFPVFVEELFAFGTQIQEGLQIVILRQIREGNGRIL